MKPSLLAVVLALAAAAPAAAALPRDPAQLAPVLARATADLDAAIGRWADRSHGDAPPEVARDALAVQRIYLLLSQRPELAPPTIARLTGALAARARDYVEARGELVRLSTPRPLSAFRAGHALPAGVLVGYYREAQRRFGVRWQLLAAVNLVESAFGRVRNASVAGAQGPMQFLPATWRAYGLGGDLHDPHDAILGAAHYLHANGAPRHEYRALLGYNHSPLYVDAVLRYARQIARDPREYLALYARQVFVRTPAGLRRLTGPPLR